MDDVLERLRRASERLKNLTERPDPHSPETPGPTVPPVPRKSR
jgi:hypothetical protein